MHETFLNAVPGTTHVGTGDRSGVSPQMKLLHKVIDFVFAREIWITKNTKRQSDDAAPKQNIDTKLHAT